MKKAFVLVLAALALAACGSSRNYNNYPDDMGYGQHRGHRDRGDGGYRAGFEAGRDDGAAYVCSSVRRVSREVFEDLRYQSVCR